MKKHISLSLILALILLPSFAQKNNTAPASLPKAEEGYIFTPVIELKATPVKNQSATGTCWCFSTTSFIESELIRMGKGEFDLSEMYVVRENYIDRLEDNYLRRGKGNTGPGSLAHDWMRVFSEYGIVPDEVYAGLNYGSPTHNHGELQQFINAVSAIPVQQKKESEQYHKIVDAILDIYLDKVPESFIYKGATFTPRTFAVSLGINPEDYIEITSFTHFPFYAQGILEIPDNWRMARFYNVPLDELIEIIDYSFNQGYTVNWDGDVSESGFFHENGFAVMPLNTPEKTNKILVGATSSVPRPGPEINVTQEIRQAGYENFTTTDDHLMHLTVLS